MSDGVNLRELEKVLIESVDACSPVGNMHDESTSGQIHSLRLASGAAHGETTMEEIIRSAEKLLHLAAEFLASAADALHLIVDLSDTAEELLSSFEEAPEMDQSRAAAEAILVAQDRHVAKLEKSIGAVVSALHAWVRETLPEIRKAMDA